MEFLIAKHGGDGVMRQSCTRVRVLGAAGNVVLPKTQNNTKSNWRSQQYVDAIAVGAFKQKSSKINVSSIAGRDLGLSKDSLQAQCSSILISSNANRRIYVNCLKHHILSSF